MDPVQLALIILGLVAILGGVLALVAAMWTLRARPSKPKAQSDPASSSYARQEMDPAPTLDRADQEPAGLAPPPQANAPSGFAAGGLDGSMGEEDDEDEIPTTVLNASAFADLDDMMAAIDDLDRRDSS